MKLKAIYLAERVIDETGTRQHFMAIRQKYEVPIKMVAAHMQISAQYLYDLESGYRPWKPGLVKKFISAMNNRNVLKAVV